MSVINANMTKEEKKEVEETTDQDASTDEKNKSAEGKQASEPKVDDIDYKAELEREKKLRDKAGEKIERLKKEKKELEGKQGNASSETDDALETIKQEIQDLKKTFTRTSYEQTINKFASSESERELIEYHLENSIKGSGDFEADVKNAKALANSAKLFQINKELVNSMNSKETKGSEDSSSYKSKQKEEKKLSSREKAFMNAMKNFK